MIPVSPVVPGKDFREINIAEHQPEYMTLPAVSCGGGVILSRWEFTEEEKESLGWNPVLYVFMWTFGGEPMPLIVQFEKPEFPLTFNEYKPLKTVPYDERTLLAKIQLTAEDLQAIAESSSAFVFMQNSNEPVMPLCLQVEQPAVFTPSIMTLARWTDEMLKTAENADLHPFLADCDDCGHKVIGTEVTSQVILEHPDTKIICSVCFEKMKDADPSIHATFLPETAAEYEKLKESLFI